MSGTGGILTTNQRREPNPSLLPFNGANNGVSIDNTTGKVVLGEDEDSTSAGLLDARQIPMNNFALGFFLDIPTNERFFINNNGAALNTEFGNNVNAVLPFLFHATMNAQPFETEMNNDGVGASTEARHAISVQGVAVAHVGALVDSPTFGDVAFLRGVNTDLALITDQPGHAILMYANNHLRQRINPAGSIEFLNLANATVQEFSTNGDVAIAGSISTGNPSAGNANWMLGTIRAGAVVADLTQSVQVKIGGTLVNLLVGT